MKKIISRYIFKEHLGPFFFALTLIMFIFLMQFLVKYIHQIFGKGIPLLTIFELIFLNMAWMLALAVPMSTLVAVLMAFGRFSSDNEITILKSSGVSIYRVIQPSLLFGLIITLFMVYFNDQILPDTNFKARKLFQAIRQKKPTLTVEERIFYELSSYSFSVDDIEKPLADEWLSLIEVLGPEYRTQENPERLRYVTIFDRSDPNKIVTINAEEGYMVYSKPQKALIFTLFTGEYHEIDINKPEEYQRSEFERHIVYIPAKNFELEEYQSNSRTDREMNISMMQEQVEKNAEKSIEQNDKSIEELDKQFEKILTLIEKMDSDSFQVSLTQSDSIKIDNDELYKARLRAVREVDRHLHKMRSNTSLLESYQKNVNKFLVEIHKKLSIPFASIVFVLVGGPLGIMARRGNLGVAFSLSLGFFVLYWAFLIGGEKLADRQLVSPILAMWAANIITFFFGSYLIFRAVRESSFINWEKLQRIFHIKSKQSAEDD